jgi:hypothetical protein
VNSHKLEEVELEEKDLVDLIRTGTALLSRRALRRQRNELEFRELKKLRAARASGTEYNYSFRELIEA